MCIGCMLQISCQPNMAVPQLSKLSEHIVPDIIHSLFGGCQMPQQGAPDIDPENEEFVIFMRATSGVSMASLCL